MVSLQAARLYLRLNALVWGLVCAGLGYMTFKDPGAFLKSDFFSEGAAKNVSDETTNVAQLWGLWILNSGLIVLPVALVTSKNLNILAWLNVGITGSAALGAYTWSELVTAALYKDDVQDKAKFSFALFAGTSALGLVLAKLATDAAQSSKKKRRSSSSRRSSPARKNSRK